VRQPAHHRGRQHRKAAHARQDRDAARLRGGIELRDPCDEVGPVGEVEVVDAEREAGAHQTIGIAGVALKRPGRIDHEVGLGGRQRRLDVAVALEGERLEPRGCGEPRAEGRGLVAGAAGNDQREPRLVGEQLRQPAAERAVAAEDEDAHRTHPRNRSAQRGSGR
jgi:hypothetical protein